MSMHVGRPRPHVFIRFNTNEQIIILLDTNLLNTVTINKIEKTV